MRLASCIAIWVGLAALPGRGEDSLDFRGAQLPNPPPAGAVEHAGPESGTPSGAEAPSGSLPLPATNHVEFTRDIRPILERSCWRCHGGERPRSNFSLRTRERALRGGEEGVDIVPGDSAGSRLIRFVAGLDPEIQMPPEGRGEPLSDEEISLLRAWIDQGVAWETGGESFQLIDFSPRFGWVGVSGDVNKFREQWGLREGWNAGVEHFGLTQRQDSGAEQTMEVRWLQDDYRLFFQSRKPELGFVRVGWEQYRKWYDDTGGTFAAFTPSTLSLGRDLYLDEGRAWADFGLTLPNWPSITVGYELQYRNGAKSTLQWGSVTDGVETRNIYPAAKDITERVHILKLDVAHDIDAWHIEDSFRGEFYDLSTARDNVTEFDLGAPGPSQVQQARDDVHWFEGANSLTVERPIEDWWLASAGWHYSHLEADAAFSLDTLFPQGVPSFAIADEWRSHGITLSRETQAVSGTSLLGPWHDLTLTAGVLGEWTRERGVGAGNQDLILLPANFRIAEPFTFDANVDKTHAAEQLVLRWTAVPFTVLFAEGQLDQESIGHDQEEVGGPHEFTRDTIASRNGYDARLGFNTSPWQTLSFGGHWRTRSSTVRYDILVDQSDHGPGYPAFIHGRDLNQQEFEARVVVQPNYWLKTTLTYRHETADYLVDTGSVTEAVPDDISPGGWLGSASEHADVFSLGTTLTPFGRLMFTGTASYRRSDLVAFDNASPSIAPWQGDVVSVMAAATYVLGDRSDAQVNYSFSRGDYAQANAADGLPLGTLYHLHSVIAGVSRRFSETVSARLQYGFYLYDEPTSLGANDYMAHAVFGALVFKF
jgi:hypothetical protein